ncbi:MAG: hypothetical protein ACI9XB_000636 [Gammaproteobacteria bacterium]|jgi:hypothetical protein
MRQMLSLLLASLLSFSLFANTNTTADDYTFTIHIGAFVKANPSDFEEIKPYGFMYAQRISNLLQVYMGDYPTEGQAVTVLNKVKKHNYPDAFITRRDLRKGKNTTVVQLTTKQVGETINWQYYATAGKLFVLLEGNTVKILTGPFTSLSESNNYVSNVKSLGFNGAFTKKVNGILLHPITDFEAGEILNYNNTSALATISVPKAETLTEKAATPSSSLFVLPPKQEKKVVKATAPKADVLTTKEAIISENYNLVEKRLKPKPDLRPKSKPVIKKAPVKKAIPKEKTTPTPTVVKKTPKVKTVIKPVVVKIPVPKTRAKVKRNSAYNLQMIMKQEGVYNNSLDGYYGSGTKKGWEAVQQSNAQLRKYIILAGLEEEMTEKSAAHILQHYVNTLDKNPEKSINAFKNSKEAVAKAYQAYAIFAQNGADKKVNDLMNAAVKQAFSNKKLENKPPFDYSVTYDYKNINQLILHLRYIQGAATEQVAAPAWLFLEHPKAAQAAFEPYAEFIDDSYPIEDAMRLFDWSEFKLLETILNDLNTNTEAKADQANQYLRSRLLLMPKGLSQDAHVIITQWNKNLWTKMDEWGAKDGLHGKLLTPLKLSYFQTLVRLEDYYMDKGFDSRTATALGLKVMKTFVEAPLSQY